VSAILWTSCSTTKNLPDDEVLYTGIRKIDFTDKEKNTDAEEVMEEIDAAVAYPPNNALLGSSSIRIPFPFGLWVYNAFVNKKGKLNKFIFNKFAANPVYVSRVNPDVRTKVASNLLKEYGFFRGSVSYEVIPDPKNSKKASIDYTITMNEPFTYDSIAFVGLRRRLDSLMIEDRAKSLIKKGDYFNVNVLAEEQERISTMLRDQGFYYFRPEFITYQADTLMNPGKVALHISMKPNLPRNVIRPWKLKIEKIQFFNKFCINIFNKLNNYNKKDKSYYKNYNYLNNRKKNIRYKK
jgi:hypothetical protein